MGPPVALAGIAARALPRPLLEQVSTAAMDQLARRHPGLFERLNGYADADILIEATDFGIGLRLWPGAAPPRLKVVTAREFSPPPAACVRGPFAALIGLLEGSLDGDALFFSRDLMIEGDTELVLALRNAIESAEIDLAVDLLAPLAPFDAPARAMIGFGGRLMRRAFRDAEIVRSMFAMPSELRAVEAALAGLREEVRQVQVPPRRPARARP